MAIPAIPIILGTRGVNDAYGIKVELDATAWFAVSGYSLSLLFDGMKAQGIISHSTFPATNWLIISLMAIHHITVVIPLIESQRKARVTELANWQSFKNFLKDPAGLDEFKEFTVREFSVENVLFYERYCEIGTLSDTKDRQQALKGLYTDFVKSGAELELNLRSETAREIKKRFEIEPPPQDPKMSDDDELDLEVFGPAVNEVVRLMYENTYLRYLKHRTTERQRGGWCGQWLRGLRGNTRRVSEVWAGPSWSVGVV